MSAVIIFVTVPDRAVGKRIAETLVAERLAACVNLVPGLFSVYRWQGRVEQESEELLVIKTRGEWVERLTARVQALHPYTVPEIIALPIIGGSSPYLDWIIQETGA